MIRYKGACVSYLQLCSNNFCETLFVVLDKILKWTIIMSMHTYIHIERIENFQFMYFNTKNSRKCGEKNSPILKYFLITDIMLFEHDKIKYF